VPGLTRAAPRFRSAEPTYFALLRPRSSAILNVQPRTPPVASSLRPRHARNLARHDCAWECIVHSTITGRSSSTVPIWWGEWDSTGQWVAPPASRRGERILRMAETGLRPAGVPPPERSAGGGGRPDVARPAWRVLLKLR
jgi:hypothetical protein